VATATTSFGKLQVQYVFAYPRKESDSQVTVSLKELGVSGSVFAYNWVTHKGQVVADDGSLEMKFADGWAYQVLSPVSQEGIALLGDSDKITPMGRARIADVSASVDGDISATIRFASGEKVQKISGYAPHRPTIEAISGNIAKTDYDEIAHMFTVHVTPGSSQQAEIRISAQAPRK